MSTYLNALALSGQRIDHLVEPHATGALAQQIAGYREVPPFLVARCKRDLVPD
jgi:hypothetical protein